MKSGNFARLDHTVPGPQRGASRCLPATFDSSPFPQAAPLRHPRDSERTHSALSVLCAGRVSSDTSPNLRPKKNWPTSARCRIAYSIANSRFFFWHFPSVSMEEPTNQASSSRGMYAHHDHTRSRFSSSSSEVPPADGPARRSIYASTDSEAPERLNAECRPMTGDDGGRGDNTSQDETRRPRWLWLWFCL